MPKHFLNLLSLFLIVLLLLVACKKDQAPDLVGSEMFSIAEAKAWYNTKIQIQQSNTTASRLSSIKKIKNFTPFWDKAITT